MAVSVPKDAVVPLRGVKLGVFALALVVGWVFVLWSNKFHVTAPAVMVCLGYLCVVSLVFNLWRTGTAAVAPDAASDDWARPIGAIGELEKEKKTLLKAIKEAEFDQAMGKLSKRDAESLIAQYRVRAIEVIKELDRQKSDGTLTVREQIEREVKARRELAAKEKPSKRAKDAAAKKDARVDAKADAKVDPKAEPPVEPKAEPPAEPAETPVVTPVVTPLEAAAKPEQVELLLAEAGDIEKLEALLGARDGVAKVERIDGGACVSVDDHARVIGLMTACEGAGIRVRSFSVRAAGESS